VQYSKKTSAAIATSTVKQDLFRGVINEVVQFTVFMITRITRTATITRIQEYQLFASADTFVSCGNFSK
jgi:uncharacterized membrane protein YjfL (UPF0719 family)